MNHKEDVSGIATLLVVCVVQFLTPFMMSGVGVALPTIGRHYTTTAVELGLVETVFILAVSLLLLPVGQVSDIFGRKKVFLWGLVLFIASALGAPFSQNMKIFIMFRFLQGCGAAMITGTSLAILSSVFPPEKRGKVMGIVVGSVYLGVSAGPVLGGWLIAWVGWQWIFYSAGAIGAMAWALTVMKLKGEWIETPGESFDLSGSSIYVISLFLFIFGMINISSGLVSKTMTGAGITGLILFIIHQYHKKTPILDVRLIASNRVFAFSNIATFINYAASFGLTFFFSLYLQYIKGLSPQAAGMILVSQPALQAVLSPISGILAEKIQPAKLSTAGMAICAVGLALAATVDGSTGYFRIVLILGVMGFGFALFSTPNMLTVMGSVQPKNYGIASSLVSTMRTIGMLASMTIVTLIFSFHMGERAVEPETYGMFFRGMHSAFLIFSGLSILGIFFSMARMPEKNEMPTRTERG
jgi:EmrB/QacA subfamily drug resistance transporter